MSAAKRGSDATIYAGKPQSLEPPTGRRGLRGPTALVIGIWIAVALVSLGRHLF